MSFLRLSVVRSCLLMLMCFLPALVFAQSSVYVVSGTGGVLAIDSGGNATNIPINLGSGFGHCTGNDGLPPYALTTAAISPDGARLYVVAHETNSIAVFDISVTPQQQIFPSVPVGNCPQYLALSPDGIRLYVSETGAGKLGVIDTTLIGTSTPPEIADIFIGNEPAGVAFTPDGNSIWVADQASSVDIIDANPADSTYNTIVNHYTVQDPLLVGISSDGAKGYIDASSSTLHFTPNLNTPFPSSYTFSLGNTAATAVAFSPDSAQLLVAGCAGYSCSSGNLAVINTSTFSVTSYPNVFGSNPAWITYNSDATRVYVTNAQSNSVSVLYANTFSPAQPPIPANDPLGAASLLPVSAPVTSAAPVQVGLISVSFGGVSAPGTVTATPISTSQLASLSGFSLTSIAWDISTTASFSSGAIVCFRLPSITDPLTFSSLRVLHYINGTPQDATITTGPYAPSPQTQTICAFANSLSPFVIAKQGGSGGASTSTYINAPSATYGTPAAVNVYVSSNSGNVSGSVSLTIDGAPGPSQSLSNGSTTFYISGLAAGSHNLSVTFPQQGNFSSSSATSSLYVSPASLTITAHDATRLLNAPNPLFTASYNGFVSGEGPGVLSGTLSCTTTAATNSPVGSYPISCSGQSSTNYLINYVAGMLKVLYASSGSCAGNVGHQILQPINADGTSVWKQGSTVPAIFRVCDTNGISIGVPGVVKAFTLYQVSANTVSAVDESPTSTTPDTAFRWDPAALQWIYNVSTKLAPVNVAPATYFFRIDLNDGTSIYFDFGLR